MMAKALYSPGECPYCRRIAFGGDEHLDRCRKKATAAFDAARRAKSKARVAAALWAQCEDLLRRQLSGLNGSQKSRLESVRLRLDRLGPNRSALEDLDLPDLPPLLEEEEEES